MVPLYNYKGDIKNCNNYRNINLLSYTMKILERVVEVKVRRSVSIFQEPVRINAGVFDYGSYHLVRRLVEQCRERKKDLYMVCIDLEKRVMKSRGRFWWRCLEVTSVSVAYNMIIRDVYDGTKTRPWVSTVGGESKHFPIMMGLHQ